MATLIKSIAEDGQADIGLDYAWLDDVTYMDWQVRNLFVYYFSVLIYLYDQRYHALLDSKHSLSSLRYPV